MSEGLSTTTIDRLLTDTRAALDRMRTTPAAPTSGPGVVNATDADLLCADGTDESGRASVTVSLPGRISELSIDPRLLREGSEAVCDALQDTMNRISRQD